MITAENQTEYYQVLLDKNPDYEGVFYVGVKTTGVFCRPTCPARKPKFENCEFFETAQQALLASFRPCQRCHPLSPSESGLRACSNPCERCGRRSFKTMEREGLPRLIR